MSLKLVLWSPEFKIFKDGDMTEIRLKGISLEGQKTKVTLVRAVYFKSKCVLADDPLYVFYVLLSLFFYFTASSREAGQRTSPGSLMQLRTGHVPFKEHLYRIKKVHLMPLGRRNCFPVLQIMM
ncbi:hypothetical protein BU17DRAFT_43692 [Hysterangium stoloniferum]|nr:hypothetical protein BU17DRAFT_43692 [Hysterangium stoloniferum]